MNGRIAIGFICAAVIGVSITAQQPTHLNPQVDLLIAKKAIFGLGVPSPGGGRGGRPGGAPGGGAPTTPAPTPATPAPPPKTPAELAVDAAAHPEADFFFTAMMERNIDGGSATMTGLQDALAAAGPLTSSGQKRLIMPVTSKAPNISAPDMPADPAKYATNIARQLNVGISSIAFVEVDSAEELRQGIAAMRFKSKGGLRPDDDLGMAPKYWGISEPDYRKRADVWPLNPEGDLVVWAIVETKEGLANVREIAQVKGLSVLAPGAGTLGGVFSSMVDGKRVRDDVAWEAAIQSVLSACKEFKVPCAYPVNENDIETRYQQGFTVGILQAFNDAAFRTVAKGRTISGR